MPADHEFESLRELIYKLSERVTILEVWRDNEKTKHAAAPAWLFGAISATVSIAMLLLNLYLAGH